MPRVINRRDTRPSIAAVYIGRPSKWGNHFVIGVDGTREEVINQYENWLLDRHDLLDDLEELRGKDLVCWCAPLPCHGDILLRLANEGEQ